MQGSAQCRFYGLTPSVLNDLSALSLQIQGQGVNNASHTSLTIQAGDAVAGMQTVFVGPVLESWVDASGEPDVCLSVAATSGALGAVTAIPATSFGAPVDAAVALAGIAKQCGLNFERNGVSKIIPNGYLWGAVNQQVDKICETASLEYTVDFTTSPPTLAIWPRGTARGTTISVISPATGMVGSPQFNAQGVNVTLAFNPTIRFGETVQIQSQVLAACGRFFVTGVWHMLESETPGGAWFTTLACSVLPNMKPSM